MKRKKNLSQKELEELLKQEAMEYARTFNDLRQKQEGKTFLGKELDALLKKYGFNAYLISELKKMHQFEMIQSGTSRLYQFKPKISTGYEMMQTCIKLARQRMCEAKKKPASKEITQLTPEEEAVKLLKEQGYQLKKCVGFDLERFQKECPQIYQKYLRYECI